MSHLQIFFVKYSIFHAKFHNNNTNNGCEHEVIKEKLYNRLDLKLKNTEV